MTCGLLPRSDTAIAWTRRVLWFCKSSLNVRENNDNISMHIGPLTVYLERLQTPEHSSATVALKRTQHKSLACSKPEKRNAVQTPTQRRAEGMGREDREKARERCQKNVGDKTTVWKNHHVHNPELSANTSTTSAQCATPQCPTRPLSSILHWRNSIAEAKILSQSRRGTRPGTTTRSAGLPEIALQSTSGKCW